MRSVESGSKLLEGGQPKKTGKFGCILCIASCGLHFQWMHMPSLTCIGHFNRRDWIAMGEKKNSYIPSKPDEYYGDLGQWISWVR